MVKYSNVTLDRIFAALSDPTRRGLLAQLAGQDTLSISELAAPFDMTLPAVMKHLDVLSDAGLVKRSKNGRIVSCALEAKPMQQANDWLERYARFWSASFDRLEQVLEDEKWMPQQQSQASPSSGASRRRRPRSMRPGAGRKS